MHDYFHSKGIMIYPGKLEKLNTFRITNIVEITCKNMKLFLDLLKKYLKKICYIK